MMKKSPSKCVTYRPDENGNLVEVNDKIPKSDSVRRGKYFAVLDVSTNKLVAKEIGIKDAIPIMENQATYKLVIYAGENCLKSINEAEKYMMYKALYWSKGLTKPEHFVKHITE
jgi:hypothetical protein